MDIYSRVELLKAWKAAKEAWVPPVKPTSGLPPYRYAMHWIADKVRQEDKEFGAAMAPMPFVKIVNPSFDRVQEAMRWIGKDKPCHVALRYHPVSEEKVAAATDPVGTARRHAAYWINQLNTTYKSFDRSRLRVMGINEPTIHTPAQEVAQALYSQVFMEELQPHGIGAWVFNFSVGWPREEAGHIFWDNFLYLAPLINETDSFGSVHEYGYPHIVRNGWGSYGNRIARCPMKIRFVIGECGYTRQLADLPQPWGWNGNIPAEAYADMMWEYMDKVDPTKVFGACIFTTSYGGEEWRNKDTLPAHPQLLARKRNFSWPSPWPYYAEEEEEDLKIVLLWPKMPRITQWYGPSHNGLDISMVSRTPIYAMWNGKVAWSAKDTASNGGYGNYVRVNLADVGFDQFVAHLDTREVEQGDTVKRGDLLGYSGNTGNSTGPHLHMEIRMKDRVGSPVDAANVGPHGRGQVDPMAVRCAYERLFGIEEK